MPLYEYQCDACGKRFEIIQKFSDAAPDACKHCRQGPVHRLMSSPAIQFKGSGFYITDYAKKTSPDSSGSDSARSDGGKSAGGSGEGGAGDGAKSDAGKGDAGKSESAKTESVKSDSTKSDTSTKSDAKSTSSPGPSKTS